MGTTLEIKTDELKDEIAILLKKFRNTPGWKTDKVNQLKNIVKILKNDGFEKFYLKEYRYHVGKVGNSYCYEITEKRRGLFAKFRGKSVRVICIESGRYDKTVMVKAIDCGDMKVD